MIDLNILKIAGAFIAGLAGLIGILGQTRTQDNKLTRSGKWLFGMAIVGVMLAVSTQIWEWRKSIEDDRIARLKNQELLVKLDNEAQLAAKSLHEVKRAVTRFQTISFDWYCSFDSTNKEFGEYIRDLAKLAEDSTFDPPSKMSDRGLRVFETHPKFGVDALAIEADSPAMPDESKYALLRHYILDVVPEIRVFKTPISPEDFVDLVADPVNPHHDPRQPDLVLKLSPGKVSIMFPIQKIEPKVPAITVVHSNMDASIQVTSGDIVSLEDLGGTQAIIHLRARKEFQELWNTASNSWLNCRVNAQIIKGSSITPPLARRGSNVVSAQTHDQHAPHRIYSFIFPNLGSAKVDH